MHPPGCIVAAMQLRSIVLLLSVALGCTDVEPPAGQCRFDSDCDEGAVCAGNYCRTGCVTDRDCAAGQRCSESDRFGVLTCHAIAVAAQCNRTSDCPSGLSCLDGVCRAQCQQDYDCQVINPFFRCVSNACALSCAAGAADCDGASSNGCEARTDSIAHCGRCGNACAGAPHADATCTATGCGTRCQQGYADCDGVASNGCEVELAVDASHCGACGRACSVINGQGQCAAGVCGRARCNATFDDCDGVAANGCEARIDSAAHCGRCGNACTASMLCTAGACASSCTGGTTLCGESCVDTRTSATDCGRCGNACPSAPNASPSCAASACDIVCNPGFSRSASGCIPIAAPRLVAPASLSTLNGNRDVVFEVALAPGTDGAVIELCRDRACTMVVERFVGAGARITRSGALSPGLYFWRSYGRVGPNAGIAPSALTWEVLVPARAVTGDASSGAVLDVNGDGFADLAVSEPGTERVMLYPGSATGPGARPATTLTLALPMSALGRDLAAGDFNGDGFADLVATAPMAQQVHVFSGSATGLGATGLVRTRVVIGSYGTGVATGDFNHDGYADLAVGFSCFKGCRPGVDVFLGSATGLGATPVTITTPDPFSDFGDRLAVLGRLAPGAAFDSLVVLMRSKGGSSLVVYRGSATGIATTPTQTIALGEPASAVAAVGDVNGDGLPDLAVVSQGGTGAPGLQIFMGAADGLATTAATITDGENLGGPVAALGDVNGDGFADLIAGNGFHSARVFLGSGSGRMVPGPVLSAPAAPTGMEGYGRFSQGLGFVGDLNRDGFDDIAVGAPDDGDNFCSGEVFVFPGRATFVAPLTPSIILTVPDARCSGSFGGAIASFARPPLRARIS